MTTTHLTPEQRAERDAAIAEARANGMGVEAAAELFSIDKANITRAVQRNEKRMRAQADADSMDYADPCDYATQTPADAPNGAEPTPAPAEPFTPSTARMEPQKTHAVSPVETMNSTPEHSRTSKTPTGPHSDTVSATRQATTPDELPDGPEHIVFTHSPATRAVWHAARARMASPWGVLGYVMALTVATTGPHVRTPATVGGAASINLLVGLVGAPGAGKGAARRTALDLFTYADSNGTPVDTPMRGIGSGEGIAETFAVKTRKGDNGEETTTQDTIRAVFDDTEISALAKKSDRRGSTLLPMLCKAYMGEDLGNQNGSADSSRLVPDHSYRMCLTVGIQPNRAGVLLDDVSGGTPQRVLWMPVPYPGMPDVTPKTPEKFTIALPFGTMQTVRPGVEAMTVTIPEVAERAIRKARLSSGRGESQGLDGHLLLTREKVAIALALMSGSMTVTDADWSAAGAVIDLSTRTRELCREECKGAAVDAAAARRIEDAEGRDQATDALAEKYATAVRSRVLSALDDAAGMPVSHSDLHRRLSGRKQSDGLTQRDRLPEVLRTLVDDGLILSSETTDGNGNDTTEYTLPRQ